MSKKKKFQCKFCNKIFSREESLLTHICEKKRRFNERNNRINIVAFNCWKMFMENIQLKKESLDYEEFMNSKLYTGFIKYARHLKDLNVIDSNEYTKFLISNNISIKDLNKDYPYESYMRQTLAKESPDKAIERGLFLIEEWAETNNSDMRSFFEKINTQKAVYLITTGKISPWMIFCSDNSEKLLNRLTPEQMTIVNNFIDSSRWKVKIQKFNDEFNRIKNTLKEVGI